MTLEDVTIELMESNEKLKIISNHTHDTNEYLLLAIDTFTSKFSELIEFFKGNSLLEIEKAREQKEYQEDLLDAIEGIELTQDQKDTQIAEGFLDSLARLGVLFGGLALSAAAISGAFVSFLKNVRATIKGISALAKLLSPAKITKAVTKIFDTIGDFLKLRLTAAGGAFGFAISGIVSFFKTVGTFFKESIFKIPGVKGVVDTITRAIKAIKNVVANSAKIGNAATSIGKAFSSFRIVFGLIFKFVSRIFAPLYTLYETIVGIWQGYQNGGFVEAIKGGITGFFKGFIGDFLNLIKDAAAWVAGKLGFTEAEKLLDAFDFNVLFTKFIGIVFTTGEQLINFFKDQLGFGEDDPEQKTFGDKIKTAALGLLTLPFNLAKTAIAKVVGLLGFEDLEKDLEEFSAVDFLKKIVNKVFSVLDDIGKWIGDQFDFSKLQNKLSGMMPSTDAAERFIKEALRNILPKPDESAGFFSVGNIVSSAIPDSVYEYAGINPETGALIKPTKIETPSDDSNATNITNAPVLEYEGKTYTPNEFKKAVSDGDIDEDTAEQIVRNYKKQKAMAMVEAPANKKAEVLSSEAQASQIENQMASMEMSAKPSVINAPTTSNNVSNNTTNNIVNRPPSPVRQPNSPSDVFYGADISNPGGA